MLRLALPRARRGTARPIGHVRGSQWPASRCNRAIPQRSFADSKRRSPNTKPSIYDSDSIVLPGTASNTATKPQPPPPGPVLSALPTTASPATPDSTSSIPPQDVPLMPPTPPAGKIQTAPPTSIPPSRDAGSIAPTAPFPRSPVSTDITPPSPPPPPLPKRRSGRLRRFFLTLILLGALGYSAAVYYALISDNFHDTFTEYVPFGEDAVLFFEEREYRKRFPKLTNPSNRPAPDSGNRITIPSKSGVSWKVAGEEHQGSDLRTKGRHMSALDENKENVKADNAQQTPAAATGPEKDNAVEQAKKDADSPSRKSKEESAPTSLSPPPPPKNPEKPTLKPAAKPDVKPDTKPATNFVSETPQQKAERPPEVNEPSRFMPIKPIDPLNIKHAENPLVQDLVKTLNDIITVVNDDSASHKYASTISKAKNELAKVGGRIIAMKKAEQKAAEDKINATQDEFDNAANELVRRLEAEWRDQEGKWREEFESEREKISHSYEERLQNETQRAQQVQEQRMRNELLEQAIAMKQQFISEVTNRVEAERNGRLSKLSEISSSVSELEKLTADWNSVIDANLKTQHLQVAVEAVRSSLDTSNRPRPFIKELAAVKEIASDDPVVNVAIASINPTAYQRGVPTSAQLIDRFRRVAGEVRKAALLPEDAGVASHAASWLMGKFMFKKEGMAVGDDVESVLTRTETLLEEGNLDEAAREMNTLDGWAKTLSWDWLSECRRVLEVRQAMDVIAAQARLEGLRVD